MSVLLDVHAENAEEAREALLPFAELEKSPEHIHTYRISALSLWNAAAAGFSVSSIMNALRHHSRYELPAGLDEKIAGIMGRFGKLTLYETEDADGLLLLKSADPVITIEIAASTLLRKYMRPHGEDFLIPLEHRGTVKWELIKMGFPVEDRAALVAGSPLDIRLRENETAGGGIFYLRDYQKEAVRALVGDGGAGTGYGIICLPCGAGKTVVGMAAMAALRCNTLILTANTAAVHQWIRELLDKTTLAQDEIAEYTGAKKENAPVTIATYQILTWRGRKAAAGDGTTEGGTPEDDAAEYGAAGSEDFPHFRLFRERKWGLIIYDEVHLLPAPVFRVTAELQAVRRLGLTATLIREDGAETAVFSLVGPKRYDVPWKELEQKGWIAQAFCVEIHADMPKALALQYAVSDKRQKYRVAAENPLKSAIVTALTAKHRDDFIIVIGQYLDQLKTLAQKLAAPLITGKTPNKTREEIYDDFRNGRRRIIVVSKVANFAIDLPDASVAIEVSGSFGSRQEEAQRLGRILRPKKRNAYFYTIVSRYTVEEDFASNRQKFLAEQGYKYAIEHWREE
jgi:DNA excision repair protein ERCC-3